MNAPSCRVLGRLLILAVPLFSGCGLRHYQRELLERDLRWQEDELYRLTAAVEDLQDQLDAARRENETLREESADTSAPEAISTPRGVPRLDLPPAEPEIELGVPSEDGGETLRRPPSSGDVPPYDGPPQFDPVPPEDLESLPSEIGPGQGDPTTRAPRTWPQVSQITLNRLLTGGHNKDGRFGDEGLLVVVEPRDVTGQVVPVPGRISFVLMDPACEGRGARVARWDFTEAEVQRRFRQGVFGKGMKFELPWPNRPPQHGQLKLYVRLTLPDGQQLTANKAVAIDLPPGGSHEWAAVSEGDDHPLAESAATDDSSTAELATEGALDAAPGGSVGGGPTPSGDGWSARAPGNLDQAVSLPAENLTDAAPPYDPDADPETVVHEPQESLADGSADTAAGPVAQIEPPTTTERDEAGAGAADGTDSNRALGQVKRRRSASPAEGARTDETRAEDLGTRERRGWAPYR